jgi:hypothetical protein
MLAIDERIPHLTFRSNLALWLSFVKGENTEPIQMMKANGVLMFTAAEVELIIREFGRVCQDYLPPYVQFISVWDPPAGAPQTRETELRLVSLSCEIA